MAATKNSLSAFKIRKNGALNHSIINTQHFSKYIKYLVKEIITTHKNKIFF